MFDPEHAFKLFSTLPRNRFTGTDGERRAREYITDRLRDFGYEVKHEEFKVWTFRHKKVSLKCDGEKVEFRPYGFTGEEVNSLSSRMKYIEAGDKYLMDDVSEIVVLSKLPGGVKNAKLLNRLWKRGVRAVILPEPPRRPPICGGIPYEWRSKYKIPLLLRVRYEDAKRIILEKPIVEVEVEQEFFENTSANIICEAGGRGRTIALCAHYDSVYCSPGGLDNGGGVAMLLELTRILRKRKGKRRLRFLFFAAEELGLRGSEYHAGKCRRKYELLINFDIGGDILGSNAARVIGEKEITKLLKKISKESDVSLTIRQDIMSSDCMSFAKRGIPSVNFSRDSLSASNIHTPLDGYDNIHSIGFRGLGIIVEKFIDRLMSGEVEIPTIIPRKLVRKVRKYYRERLGIEI